MIHTCVPGGGGGGINAFGKLPGIGGRSVPGICGCWLKNGGGIAWNIKTKENKNKKNDKVIA